MCGIAGMVTVRGGEVSLSGEALGAVCDMLAHRGPDGAGLWRDANAALTHRRLAVIDPTPAGAQPMVFADRTTREPRLILAYNGELYNDEELRSELRAQGACFHTRSDAQTMGEAILAWGTDAMRMLRGMYAVAAYFPQTSRLLLARDPLGVKPLYWARWTVRGRDEIGFASEVGALVRMRSAATGESPRPDLAMVSAYLTTIRTTLGTRTLFQGVSVLEPGEWIEINCDSDSPVITRASWWNRARGHIHRGLGESDAAAVVRDTVRDSVLRHLRSDVPVCSLLSGGLDSTIIASVAKECMPGLMTFCAGADTAGAGEDPDCARRAVNELGLRCDVTRVDAAGFRERMRWMIMRTGSPLSTPNEVAIVEVCRRLRDTGCIVALSGEGADEVFGGYDAALDAASDFELNQSHRYDLSASADFALAYASWAPREWKRDAMRPHAWSALEGDAWLVQWTREEFSRVASQREDDHPVHAHLRWQRRVNLAGLLQRLDSSSMLAGVEGRTPFADATVLDLAESLPLALKYRAPDPDYAGPRTKLVLRRAFARDIPDFVRRRPKASFPLPFPQWVGPLSGYIGGSSILSELFHTEALRPIIEQPALHWRFAWPMVNLALWERAWWGGTG